MILDVIGVPPVLLMSFYTGLLSHSLRVISKWAIKREMSKSYIPRSLRPQGKFKPSFVDKIELIVVGCGHNGTSRSLFVNTSATKLVTSKSCLFAR